MQGRLQIAATVQDRDDDGQVGKWIAAGLMLAPYRAALSQRPALERTACR
jgi:hypothetical protein